jgi:Domain of unknown function (DUF4166)
LRVLILGGYGTFGGRLATLLADDARLTLLIAGRSAAKAAAFCTALSAKATLVPHVFDRDGDVAAQLQGAEANIVVDATGPFQAYGADPYRMVEASIALGIDYLDLADGSEFVAAIGVFDEPARQRGVFVLSGASSFPVLTIAVARSLAEGLQRVERITAGIAPSPYAGVGLNVIRAIASYAGKAVPLVRDGQAVTGHALIETRRYTICPPGRLPLHNIRFSLVDVPDLRVLPAVWPELRDVWVGAGPVPEALHRALNVLAWSVRLHLVPSLAPLARVFHRAINTLRWGEHRGGMFVSLCGIGEDGSRRERSWHLLAEGDDGPLIPSMTAAAIIRHCLDGRRPQAGARAAELALEDYDDLFRERTIHAGFRDTSDGPLYHRILGDAWHGLPAPLRSLHNVTSALTVRGRAEVARGSGWLSRLIGTLFGFPRAGHDVPVCVTFTVNGGRERWQRTFGSRSFASVQTEGRGRHARLLVERFGPFRFALAVVLNEGRLSLVARHWDFLGLPLPLWLAPDGEAYEFAADDVFHFHVEIRHWLTGLIVRYHGWLAERDVPS